MFNSNAIVDIFLRTQTPPLYGIDVRAIVFIRGLAETSLGASILRANARNDCIVM